MRWTHHHLPALALAALLGAGATLAPDDAAAQGRSHKNKADKHLEKQARRDARADRYDVRWEDDRYEDRGGAVRGNRGSAAGVPPGHMPPVGMCRIWIDGVPPGRQPAPTDCSTARRNAPANSRIIYGGRTDRRNDRYDVYDRGGVYGRGSVYDRDGDGDYDARDEAIRRREDILRGRRDDGTNTCVDANRDGRCDW